MRERKKERERENTCPYLIKAACSKSSPQMIE